VVVDGDVHRAGLEARRHDLADERRRREARQARRDVLQVAPSSRVTLTVPSSVPV
jgi:hypothetical protein